MKVFQATSTLIPLTLYKDTLNSNIRGGPFGFNWNGTPAFNTYLIGFTWDLFGQSIFGLRMASALLSSLAVATTFFLGYLLTKRPIISFLVALSLSCNPWFLNFSRDGWENIFNSLFLILVVTGLYMYSFREKYKIGIFLITLGSVLGFYGYHPGKLFIVSVFFIFYYSYIVYCLAHNKKIKPHILSLTIILSIFIILTFPQVLSGIEHEDQALGRIKEISIFNQANPREEIKNSIWRNIKGFIFFDKTTFTGYLNARYLPTDHSPINLLLLPFFLSGLIVGLKRYPYLLLTFIIVLFLPQILSQATPDAARAVHVVPLMYIFILLGIVYVYKIIRNTYMQPLYRIVIAIILVVTALSGVSTYFHWITSNTTLNARRPAVQREDYSLWIHRLQEDIKQGSYGFNVSEWEIMAQPKINTLPSNVLPAKTYRK